MPLGAATDLTHLHLDALRGAVRDGELEVFRMTGQRTIVTRRALAQFMAARAEQADPGGRKAQGRKVGLATQALRRAAKEGSSDA